MHPQLRTWIYDPDGHGYAPLACADQALLADDKLGKLYWHYAHCDQLGTPQELTSANGEVAWSASYSAWGQYQRPASFEYAQTTDCKLRFAGQYADDETGLHYNTFRYYDPRTGRYISPDPIGVLGGFNLYGYVHDPAGGIDPLGWCTQVAVTRGAAGQPLRATARIMATDIGSGTATNASSRIFAKSLGNLKDDAGHILGKLLGGSGGKNGVFPQLPGINRGAFAQFEQSVAQAANRLRAVDVDIKFIYGNLGTRPTNIVYDVFDTSGNKILSQIFGN